MDFAKLRKMTVIMLAAMVTLAAWAMIHQYHDNRQNKLLHELIDASNGQTQNNKIQDDNLELLRQVCNEYILDGSDANETKLSLLKLQEI